MSLGVLFGRFDQAGEEEKIGGRSVNALEADFSSNAVALFQELIERGCVLVPLTSSAATKKAEYVGGQGNG